MVDKVDDVRARVGAALRMWRTRRDLTQEELAARSHMSYKFIGEIERGSANPSIETLSTLAGALEIEIGELVVSGERPAGDYQLSKKQAQRLREAAESIDQVVREVLGPPPRSARRRR